MIYTKDVDYFSVLEGKYKFGKQTKLSMKMTNDIFTEDEVYVGGWARTSLYNEVNEQSRFHLAKFMIIDLFYIFEMAES